MIILQILLICWLLFIYIIVWRAIENPRALYYHGFLAQVVAEYAETKSFNTLLTWLIFILGPVFAILTYLGTILIMALIILIYIYRWFAERTSKAIKA